MEGERERDTTAFAPAATNHDATDGAIAFAGDAGAAGAAICVCACVRVHVHGCVRVQKLCGSS